MPLCTPQRPLLGYREVPACKHRYIHSCLDLLSTEMSIVERRKARGLRHSSGSSRISQLIQTSSSFFHTYIQHVFLSPPVNSCLKQTSRKNICPTPLLPSSTISGGGEQPRCTNAKACATPPTPLLSPNNRIELHRTRSSREGELIFRNPWGR